MGVASQEQKTEYQQATEKLMALQKPNFWNRAKKAYRILFNVEKKVTQAPVERTPEELRKIEEEKQKKQHLAQFKMAQQKVKEMYDLFCFLEDQAGNRVQRKQFRRDFITNGAFGRQVLENTMSFYKMKEKAIEASLQEKTADALKAKIAPAAQPSK